MSQEHSDSHAAASVAMSEVTGAVVATSLVLVAVFVPVAFFPGTTGLLYKQFSLTIAFSIAISAFNSLTFTPSLSALLLRPETGRKNFFFRGVEHVIHRTTAYYVVGAKKALKIRYVMLAIFFAGLAATYLAYKLVPTGFVPDEDQGWFMITVQAPQGASVEYTANAVRGGWAYNRQVSPRLFVDTLNDYEHDAFQNLDLRFVAGGGFGWNAIKKENIRFDISGGGDYDRDNFGDNTHRNSAEVNYGDTLFYKASASTTVTQAFRLFNNLSRSGEYRMNFDLGTVTAIKKWLGWHVTASDRFFSNPAFGRQRNDILLSTGFRLTFAR